MEKERRQSGDADCARLLPAAVLVHIPKGGLQAHPDKVRGRAREPAVERHQGALLEHVLPDDLGLHRAARNDRNGKESG